MTPHSSNPPSLVWFRQDLRLEDNPALSQAVARGNPVIPVFIRDCDSEGTWSAGSASQWWLHHSLRSLAKDLEIHGLPLLLRSGPVSEILLQLVEETGSNAVFWNRRHEPAIIERDTLIKQQLKAGGIHAESCNGSLLFPPETIKTGQGRPYQVFTPYWKNCRTQAMQPDRPLTVPDRMIRCSKSVVSEDLNAWKLLPDIAWDSGFYDQWQPGSEGARKQLSLFLGSAASDYHEKRDLPATQGTSRLSPHLHFGEVSVREVWWTVLDAFQVCSVNDLSGGASTFLTEIGWREFAHHILFHFPQTPDAPLRDAFNRFPWENDSRTLKAWQKGQTGYPIVDAGMRQLWQTGWMHNRVRMIVGSFLCKDLMISWKEGARWFWDTLVDADLAANTLGWQWISGCGADAAPYFRIFNPVRQSEKFDPQGEYLRKWLPELAALPTRYLHSPWEAPESVMAECGLVLGKHYPLPIVDHAEARKEALQRLAVTRD